MKTASLVLAALTVLISLAAHAAEEDSQIAMLRAQVAELAAKIDELEASTRRNSVKVENLTPAKATTTSSKAVWAETIKLKGDLRYRHEQFDQDGRKDRARHRLRARFGAEARIRDDLKTVVQLASGSSDPRSTNQTLDGGFSTKNIGLDLAYFQWAASEQSNVVGGKMKNPISKPSGSRFIDGDITPEGLALNWSNEQFFLLGAGFWADERSSDDDALALVVQGGYRGELDNGMGLTAAVSYTDWEDVKHFDPLLGDSLGNSLVADGPLAGTLANDFNIVEAYAELKTSIDDLPLSFFAQYGVNTDASDDDTAFGLGVTLGKASNPGTWQVRYSYHDHEADSLLASFIDSDFGDGETDSRGHVLSGGYAFDKNLTVNFTYFLNELDVSSSDERDYQRLQLDLNFKY